MKNLYLLIYGLLLPISSVAQTSEYVPPPTGPYQSSVVINTLQSGAADETHVYKFPSADLIEQVTGKPDEIEPESIATDLAFPSEQDFVEPRTDDVIPSTNQTAPMANTNRPVDVRRPQQAQPVPPAYGSQPYANTVNPWSSSQAPYPNAYQEQNLWAQPHGRSQYQYPYGYSQQYNNNTYNSPYEYMPSPWSMMPKNPFFQGN